jgi:hypothetical protein
MGENVEYYTNGVISSSLGEATNIGLYGSPMASAAAKGIGRIPLKVRVYQAPRPIEYLPDRFYRTVGEDAITDMLNTGVIRGHKRYTEQFTG